MIRRRLAAAAVVLAAATVAAAEPVAPPERLRTLDAAALGHVYGAGRFVPEYEPPAPGSYHLPVIDTVADHPLLDTAGRPTTLYALTDSRLAVVAFVYTTCSEATGCPFSLGVLRRLDRALADDPGLAGRVTLLAVSFDPERDTPERMAVMRRFHQPRTTWHFATTRGDPDLEPLLADFGQGVAKLRFPDGEWSGLFRHVLKVFCLDADHAVRNVYSVGHLHPALVLNDLRTLVLEETRRRSRVARRVVSR